jgi:protein-S-isoprenylcysteine O-methyltransferase Ste14
VAKSLTWLGGAAFVASLALCARFYILVLGQDHAPGGWRALSVDAALMTVFAGHHSLFARERVKRWLTVVPVQLKRSVYVWVASLLLAAVCLLWQPIGGTLYRVEGPRAGAHAVIQMVGLLLIGRSVAGLDPLELAGIRQALGTAPKRDVLQVAGPYRLVRHPLYLGWMVAVFGAAHMTGDRCLFAVLTSVYLAIAVPWEEESLRQSFGDEYATYQRRVRWRIVPFVY